MFPYTAHAPIGSGSFSQIWSGYKTDDPKQERVAIKFVPMKHEMHGSQELDCLRILPSHPNILAILDTPCHVSWQNEACLAFTFQYCPGGDMFEYLQTHGRMSDKVARSYFQQLLSALQAAHKVRVCHRDIKLENILISPDGNLKLCDWGMAAHMEEDIVQSFFMGTPMYMAPELFKPQPYFPAKADAWAAVCVAFMFYTAHPPFHRPVPSDWYYETLQTDPDKYWATFTKLRLPPAFQQMVEKIFTVKEANRPTVDELLQCSWVVTGHLEWPKE